VKIFAVLFLATILVTSLLPPQSAYAAAVTFNPATSMQLSVTNPDLVGRTTMHQITSSGNSVYMVWQQNANFIEFTKSLDNGTSFSSTVQVGLASSPLVGGSGAPFDLTFLGSPQFDVSGTNISITWQDAGKIKFKASTNEGVIFEPSTTAIELRILT